MNTFQGAQVQGTRGEQICLPVEPGKARQRKAIRIRFLGAHSSQDHGKAPTHPNIKRPMSGMIYWVHKVSRNHRLPSVSPRLRVQSALQQDQGMTSKHPDPLVDHSCCYGQRRESRTKLIRFAF